MLSALPRGHSGPTALCRRRERLPVALELGELVEAHEYVARLGALGRPDHAAVFEQVHEASCSSEADAQLALQHRRRPEATRHDELHCFPQKIIIVVAIVAARSTRHGIRVTSWIGP